MSRTDKITIEQKKITYYEDFLNNFEKHPLTGYLATVTNEEAVKQSIKNLVLTIRGERFYEPNKGSTVMASLFNNMDAVTLITIRDSIIETINNYEPRAILHEVQVVPRTAENAVWVRIIFSVRNYLPEQYSLDLLITRTR
jgi:phage baseplate assembly protein W